MRSHIQTAEGGWAELGDQGEARTRAAAEIVWESG